MFTLQSSVYFLYKVVFEDLHKDKLNKHFLLDNYGKTAILHKPDGPRIQRCQGWRIAGRVIFLAVQGFGGGGGGTMSAKGARFLGGPGGMLPQKYLKIRVSKWPFPAFWDKFRTSLILP